MKGLFDAFESVPQAPQWLDLFRQEQDRYPFLGVLGPSRSRQTEWAKPFFQNPLQPDAVTLEHRPWIMLAYWWEVAPPGIPFSRAESFINIFPNVLQNVKQENYIVQKSLPSDGNPYAPIDSSNFFFKSLAPRSN